MAKATGVHGTARVTQSLRGLHDGQVAAVKRVLFTGAVNIQGGAKRRVRVYMGRLRNSIAIQSRPDGLEHRVGTNVVYARAEEFGRRPGAHPPVEPIIAWARKKGFADPEAVAWAIAKDMEQNGTRPHPFLFPAFEEERPKIVKGLRKAMNDDIRRRKR